jgi:hypothetical protein
VYPSTDKYRMNEEDWREEEKIKERKRIGNRGR